MNRYVPSVNIDEEIREKARRQAEIWLRESGKPWAMKPNIFTKDSFYLGAMGELAVSRYLGLPLIVKESLDFGYDIKLGEKRIDVKTSTLHEPMKQPLTGGFRVFVNTKTKMVDVLLFVKLEPDQSKAYPIGWIWRGDLEKAPIVQMGDMPTPAHCIYLAYTNPVEDLKGRD